MGWLLTWKTSSRYGAIMGLKCPNCGSDHTQAVSAVVQSGTSFSSGIVTGIGIGTGGVGAGVGTTTSISKTNLAARFSAPDKPTKIPTIILGLAAFGSTPWLQATGSDVGFRYASMVVWLIFLLIVAKDWKGWKTYNEYKRIWEPLYSKGFYCHSCDKSFFPK
jgi:hypothetical protein